MEFPCETARSRADDSCHDASRQGLNLCANKPCRLRQGFFVGTEKILWNMSMQ
jgi:hypothetical protein